MISCKQAVRMLWDYLEGEVDDGRRGAIEEHLLFCRRCCGEVEFVEELRRFLADRAIEEIPEDVHARLIAALEGM